MYAVGREHPLREEAQAFFEQHFESKQRLVSSAEVLQELMHAYVPVERVETLDRAFILAESTVHEVWPIEEEDVRFARSLVQRYLELGARELLHLACCRRRNVTRLKTYDRALSAAFERE
jgi:predicted nucleic acid-binding protein